jgi:NAD(P)-dependent dehydrogenase (short-subunit alcohol dehydrogenase family)
MTKDESRGTALVTGGARRIGRAIVRDLAANRWTVVIHCNTSVDEAEAEANTIREAGGRAYVVRADLQDGEAARTILAGAADIAGPVDLLVNNASVFLEDAIGSLDHEIWRRQFAINLEAPVFLSDAFASRLPDDMNGAIVNIIDQRVRKLTPQMMSYTLAKSALWTATQIMAQALAPRIRVNGIAPGPTFANARDGDAGLEREAAGTLLKRRIDPAEIAAAVRYLAESPSITGQLLAVDGGQHLAWRTPDIVDP